MCIAIPVAAHVGSPDVFYEGDAGPYHLFVVVRVPQVIPGIAEVEIRCLASDVTQISIVSLRLSGEGAERVPAPETAQRSKDSPLWFTGNLWLMESGALQIRVQVLGARGKGELAVPVPSAAQRKLPMAKPLAALLICLLALLAVGAISIAVAGAKEAMLVPGEIPSQVDRRRARRVMLIASLALLGLLYLGKQWWNLADAKAAANVYKAPRVSATLEGANRLILQQEPGAQGGGVAWSQARTEPGNLDDLIPDHGHLMHLFLIRFPAMDRFLHLHPEKAGNEKFLVQLPIVPAGHYKIFADIVHQSGFPATMVGEVDLPNLSVPTGTADDSEWSGPPMSAIIKDVNTSPLPDGSRMVWERRSAPLKAGVAGTFRFRVEDQRGNPVQDLQPYMGMAGHAEFFRSDLTVFAHVHPAGSVSMAAAEIAQAGLPGKLEEAKGGNSKGMVMPMAPPSAEISFPYGFPEPGDYRIFVQVKRAGRIETGVFDAHVD